MYGMGRRTETEPPPPTAEQFLLGGKKNEKKYLKGERGRAWLLGSTVGRHIIPEVHFVCIPLVGHGTVGA